MGGIHVKGSARCMVEREKGWGGGVGWRGGALVLMHCPLLTPVGQEGGAGGGVPFPGKTVGGEGWGGVGRGGEGWGGVGRGGEGWGGVGRGGEGWGGVGRGGEGWGCLMLPRHLRPRASASRAALCFQDFERSDSS